ncbi:hypothetical protein SAMN05444278_1118 [Psychroflexus salarius]|uniref:Uncharacterized protein n=1 Tax=Psychroflexus salarius TaxID=1155689 RepID=A0A1M4XXI1_9FLAO|nr:DUF6452 family protein [Psychroflexus salarius]SHE98003.1 hypothetical protein SAMN05444278_1118 [Psychroflexus salarius]
MKRKLLFIFTVLSIGLSSCERDDICPENTPTTPRLVVQFFDINNPEIQKNINELVIQSVDTDNENFIEYDNVSEIILPLKTNQNSTQFLMTINANSENESDINTDELIFNYARRNVYINRACGYKVEFLDFQVTQIEESNEDLEWIKATAVQQPNIDNENETHLFIYH